METVSGRFRNPKNMAIAGALYVWDSAHYLLASRRLRGDFAAVRTV
jgi:hypothetical protein